MRVAARLALRSALVGVTLLAAAAPEAHASRWLVGAGALISRPDDGGQTYFSRLGYGGGMFYVAPLTKTLEMEADGLLFRRQYGAGTGANSYLFTETFAELPLMLRVTFFDLLSFGAGVFYAPFLGDVAVHTDFGDFSGSHKRSYDYGYTLSARVGGELQSPIFIEYRYSQGLTNIATTGSAHYVEFQFLLGFALNGGR